MIGGAGLALMAWRLACRRVDMPTLAQWGPGSREYAAKPGNPASAAYYRIIDNATAAFRSFPRGVTVHL